MKRLTLALLLMLFNSSIICAQCSDAGVCVIGTKHSRAQHSIGVSYIYGKSKLADGLTFNTVQLEGSIHFFRDSRLSILLPWTSISGPAGSTNGIGDLSLVLNQVLLTNYSGQLSFLLGGKLATGASNAKNLPQAYQTGLGTNDLLIGLTHEIDPWLFAAGYQVSRGRSDNSFTPLRRGDDLLLRVGYGREFGEVKAMAEVLAIKRLQESDFEAVTTRAKVRIPESDQFQINVLCKGSLPMSDQLNLQGLVAVPLLNRKVNVDGLTRSMTLSLGLQYTL